MAFIIVYPEHFSANPVGSLETAVIQAGFVPSKVDVDDKVHFVCRTEAWPQYNVRLPWGILLVRTCTFIHVTHSHVNFTGSPSFSL